MTTEFCIVVLKIPMPKKNDLPPHDRRTLAEQTLSEHSNRSLEFDVILETIRNRGTIGERIGRDEAIFYISSYLHAKIHAVLDRSYNNIDANLTVESIDRTTEAYYVLYHNGKLDLALKVLDEDATYYQSSDPQIAQGIINIRDSALNEREV